MSIVKISLGFLVLIQPLILSGQVKSVVASYLKSPSFLEHKKIEEAVHGALIAGEMNDLLESFVSDTIYGQTSKVEINRLLNNNLFSHHSARIDTHFHVLTSPEKFVTQAVFRDVSYLGNNMFLRHRVEVNLIWDVENYRIRKRVIHYDTLNVKSRKTWGRGPWDDLTYEEFLKKIESK